MIKVRKKVFMGRVKIAKLWIPKLQCNNIEVGNKPLGPALWPKATSKRMKQLKMKRLQLEVGLPKLYIALVKPVKVT